MGVYSDGSYNVPSGIIYSYPVTCAKGDWTIVQGMECFFLLFTTELVTSLPGGCFCCIVSESRSENRIVVCAGLTIDEKSRAKLDATADELVEEKALAYACISE